MLLRPLAAVLALAALSTSASAATWASSDRWATWTNGGYTLYNNIWGSGYGPQTIWANSYSNFGVWSQHPNTGGIKSYPNCKKAVGKALSSLVTLKSSFNATNPSGGAWNCAYDVWDSAYAHETMLWFNWTSNVGPIGSQVYSNQTVGGHTWNVYKGWNGANNVYSFLRTSKTNSATTDLKAIQNWVKGKGWFGAITQGDVQHGWEITSSSAGLNHGMNSFSVTVQ